MAPPARVCALKSDALALEASTIGNEEGLKSMGSYNKSCAFLDMRKLTEGTEMYAARIEELGHASVISIGKSVHDLGALIGLP